MNDNTRSTNPKDILASSKAPLEFVPMSMVVYAAMQMKNGAAKYGSYNFRGTGVRASVYYAGALRHLLDWFHGAEYDEEGVPNMAGLCANIAILADAEAQGYLVDDRPPRVDMRGLFEEAEDQAKDTNARFEGKVPPRHYTLNDDTFRVLDDEDDEDRFDGGAQYPDPWKTPGWEDRDPDSGFTRAAPLEPLVRPAVDMHDAPAMQGASRYPQDLVYAAADAEYLDRRRRAHAAMVAAESKKWADGS